MEATTNSITTVDVLPDDLIPLGQAARLVPGTSARGGVNPATLCRWVEEGKLRCWRVVGRRVVSRAEVLGLIRPERAGPAKIHRATQRAADRRFTDEVLKRYGIE